MVVEYANLNPADECNANSNSACASAFPKLALAKLDAFVRVVALLIMLF